MWEKDTGRGGGNGGSGGDGNGDSEDDGEGLGVEELLVGPVNVFHEYGVAVGSGIGGRIDEEGERVKQRLDEVLGAVGEGVGSLMTELLGTDTRAAVYTTLRGLDGATPDEVADETGLPVSRVEEALRGLEEQGAVERSDGRYAAVEPADLVRTAPGRVGDWIRGSIGDEGEVRKLPIRGEKPELDAEYDEEGGEVTVRVIDGGDADYVEVLVNAEVRHEFEEPSAGDEVTVAVEREEAVVARSGCIERA